MAKEKPAYGPDNPHPLQHEKEGAKYFFAHHY